MTGYNSKRSAAQAKMDDDDAQGYIAEYEAALLLAYQSGFADGKRSAQRKPLTDEEIQKIWDVASGAIPGWSRHITFARAIEAKLKEQP